MMAVSCHPVLSLAGNAAQDTAYVNPCFSEAKQCGVPDYLDIDEKDETWCNCDLHDVCPVRLATLGPCMLRAPVRCIQYVLNRLAA